MKLEEVKNIKKFHFIGVGGVGMSALAKILLASGREVSGSDRVDSPILEELKNLGAKIFVGHDEKNFSVEISCSILSKRLSVPPQFLRTIRKFSRQPN